MVLLCDLVKYQQCNIYAVYLISHSNERDIVGISRQHRTAMLMTAMLLILKGELCTFGSDMIYSYTK